MNRILLIILLSLSILKGFGQSTDTIPLAPPLPFLSYNEVSKTRLDSLKATVPLPYNEFVQGYIDNYVVKNKGMIGKMLGLAEYFFPTFEKALKAYGVPDELKFLTIVESSLDPTAISKSGAAGLWQFMPGTAKGYGLIIDKFEDERRDPIRSSYAAAAYLKDAYAELGDWLLAIAAYNCGTGDVRRAIAKGGSRDYWAIRQLLPLQTQKYVPAFIATVYAMKYAAHHQIVLQKSSYAAKMDTIIVNRPVSITALAKVVALEEAMLVKLNPSYIHKVVNASETVAKKIVLPANRIDYTAVYTLLNETAFQPDSLAFAKEGPAKLSKIKKATESNPVLHKVIQGQNLSQIADKYKTTVEELRLTNDLKDDHLAVGQQLRIPSTGMAKQGKRS